MFLAPWDERSQRGGFAEQDGSGPTGQDCSATVCWPERGQEACVRRLWYYEEELWSNYTFVTDSSFNSTSRRLFYSVSVLTWIALVVVKEVQTIRITRTLIRDNTHDLNDTRGHSFIWDRIGTVVNVQFWDQTFRGTPSSSVKARKKKNRHFWLSLTMRESLETSDPKTEHWLPFLSYRK